jgi:hypothetical protein
MGMRDAFEKTLVALSLGWTQAHVTAGGLVSHLGDGKTKDSAAILCYCNIRFVTYDSVLDR